MHSKTLNPNPIPNHDHNQDHQNITQSLNLIPTINNDHNHDHEENAQFPNLVTDDLHDYLHGGDDNNPPDSFWISDGKVTDWLDHHTFIDFERKASVKLAISRNFDPTQTRSSQRSVSFNHKPPQASIMGFRQKPARHADGKFKQNDKQDKVRLFRNRSEPGRDFVLQVAEPRSPRVSCIGRVRSKKGRGRRTGFWKSVKAAFMNRGRTSREPKKAR